MSVEYDIKNVPIELSITPKGKRGICKAVSPKPNFEDLVQILKERALVDQDHTLLQYKGLSDTEQGKLKDNGSYVPGYFKDGIRRNDNLVRRSAITLDLDEMTPEQFDFYKSGKPKVWDWVHIAHSTRKHSRQFPRLRIIIPLKKSIPASLYEVVARYAACCVLQTRNESLDACDEVSYRPAQVAYFQTTCSDQRPVFIVNDAESGALEFLDAEAFLDEMGADTEDLSTWPYSPKRISKLVARSKRSEDPLKKPGIVGAWCNLVHQKGGMEWLIKEMLSEVYIDPDPHSHKPRYTYAKGQGKHGAVIEDDGLFLYSNHSTDPLYGQNANAWDVPRVHLFGHLDVDKDGEPLIVEPHKSATLPSHAAMDEWVRDEYPEVLSIMFKDKFDFESVADDDEEGKDDRRRKAKRKAAARDLIGDDDDEDTSDEDLFDSTDWMQKLDVTRDGEPKATFQNYVLITAHDERFRGTFRWDEMSEQTKVMRGFRSKRGLYPTTIVHDKRDGEPLKDVHGSIVKCIFTAPIGKSAVGYGFTAPPEGDLWRAIDTAAQMRPFHPLKMRVEDAAWDRRKRVETFFIKHLKLPDTKFYRDVSRLFFMAGISRIWTPGAKFDHVFVIEGAQGGGKSTFLRYLAMDDRYFGELNVDLADQQKVLEHTQGKFILEIAELAAMKKSEIEAIKAYITAVSDESRLAYDRKVTKIKRSYLLCATTNERGGYLKDPTGNRRFIPMWTPTSLDDPIDLEAVKREVPQVWAEARIMFKEWQEELGLKPHECPPLILPRESMKIAVEEASRRSAADPIDMVAEVIGEWLDTPVLKSTLSSDGFLRADESDDLVVRSAVTVAGVFRDCYGQVPGAIGGLPVRANDIQEALRRLGWENTRAWPSAVKITETSENGKRIRTNAWVRRGSTSSEIRAGYRVVRPESDDPPRNRHEKRPKSDLI